MSSLLSNCRVFDCFGKSMAGESGLVVKVVGRHIPMLSLSIFNVISKCCMAARLCSVLISTVFNDRLGYCQHTASA